jgi:hypothetical protein
MGYDGVSDCLYIYLKINSLEHENTYIVQSIYFLQCLWYVWPVGMFIYSSIYQVPRMPIISLDQQPTNHWVTKESRNGGLVKSERFAFKLLPHFFFLLWRIKAALERLDVPSSSSEDSSS